MRFVPMNLNKTYFTIQKSYCYITFKLSPSLFSISFFEKMQLAYFRANSVSMSVISLISSKPLGIRH
jgi:hypothetical protein